MAAKSTSTLEKTELNWISFLAESEKLESEEIVKENRRMIEGDR